MMQRIFGLVAVLALLFAAELAAQGDSKVPWFFKHGSWVCSTAESYKHVYEVAANRSETPVDDVPVMSFDNGKCFYLEDDQVTDIVSPYIDVLESAGEMRRIKFVLRFEKRRAFLHRDLNWYTITGWTDVANIKPLW